MAPGRLAPSPGKESLRPPLWYGASPCHCFWMQKSKDKIHTWFPDHDLVSCVSCIRVRLSLPSVDSKILEARVAQLCKPLSSVRISHFDCGVMERVKIIIDHAVKICTCNVKLSDNT